MKRILYVHSNDSQCSMTINDETITDFSNKYFATRYLKNHKQARFNHKNENYTHIYEERNEGNFCNITTIAN